MRVGTENVKLLIKVTEASQALSISERKLWELTTSGEIPSVRIGRSVRYAVDDLNAWINEKKANGRP